MAECTRSSISGTKVKLKEKLSEGHILDDQYKYCGGSILIPL
jgi:hypothetical protein